MTIPDKPQQPDERAKPKPKAGAAAGIITLVIFVLCLGGGVAVAAFGGSDPDPAGDDNSTGAEVACEEFVGKRLKAPASAEYPDPQTVKDGAAYTVSGVVDSQNSFGAMVRNTYTCKVTDQGDTWLLNDLQLSSK